MKTVLLSFSQWEKGLGDVSVAARSAGEKLGCAQGDRPQNLYINLTKAEPELGLTRDYYLFEYVEL